ncbi:MAG TPA: hypothetical protein VHB99_14600 [Pirellulales bacterium]|nr:hypothetical protein [Pirellulales bacterium]
MLAANERLAAALSPHEKTRWKRQIDRLVYALYGLSDDEIATIEAAGD